MPKPKLLTRTRAEVREVRERNRRQEANYIAHTAAIQQREWQRDLHLAMGRRMRAAADDVMGSAMGDSEKRAAARELLEASVALKKAGDRYNPPKRRR